MWIPTLLLAAFWLWMLIDSLRRKEFPPLLGSERLARVFWRGSFLLCNPLLAALYAAAIRWNTMPGPSAMREILILGGGTLATALQFGFLGTVGDEPFVLRRDDSAPSSTMFAVTLRGMAKIHTSQVGTASHDGLGLLPAAQRKIRVVSASRHPVIVLAARNTAQRLARLPFVERVEYRPAGPGGEVGDHGPDLYVVLAEDDLSSLILPLYARTTGTIFLSMGRTPLSHPGIPHRSLHYPAARKDLSGTMSLRANGIGIAYGAGLYQDIAEEIEDWATAAVTDAMRGSHEATGTLPTRTAFYAYEQTPPLAFLENRTTTRLDSESSFALHNRTRWHLEDDRPLPVILEEFVAEATGWKQDLRHVRGEESALILRRGPELLTVARWPVIPDIRPESSTPRLITAPIHIVYEKAFTTSELEGLALESLEQGADPTILRVLLPHCPAPRRKEFRTALRTNAMGHGARGLMLALARQAHAEGETAEARADIRRGLLFVKLRGKKDQIARRLEELAEELGVEQPVLSLESLLDVGYMQLGSDPAPSLRWVAPGGRLAYVLERPDGALNRLYVTPQPRSGKVLDVKYEWHEAQMTTAGSWSVWIDPQGEFRNVEQRFGGHRVRLDGKLADDGSVEASLRLIR